MPTTPASKPTTATEAPAVAICAWCATSRGVGLFTYHRTGLIRLLSPPCRDVAATISARPLT